MKIYSVRLPDNTIPPGVNPTEYIRMKLGVYAEGGGLTKPKEWTFLERFFGKNKVANFNKKQHE